MSRHPLRPVLSLAAGIGALLVLGVAAGRAAQVLRHDAEWTAPPAAVERVNPLAGRLDAVAGGDRLFRQRCEACHGPRREGGPKAPSLADPAVLEQTDGTLFWKISSGNTRAGMPAFSFLPEPQRWQLVLAIRRPPRSGE